MDIDAEQLAAMVGVGGGVLGAGGIVFATAAGVAKDLLGEDGETDGRGVVVPAGVPLPPLLGVGEGDVAVLVVAGALPAEVLCEGAQAPPVMNRARQAVSMANPCFRPSTPSNPDTVTPPG